MPGLEPIYIADRDVGTANAVVVCHMPANAWDKRHNISPVMGAATPHEISNVFEYGESDLVRLPPQSYLAVVRGREWEIYANKRWVGEKPTTLDLMRTLALVQTMRVLPCVWWSARNGFEPRAGALGLTKPEWDITLRWDNALLRVVIGSASPFGRGVFAFDNLKQDENGHPHPRGLYVLCGELL